jgi:hypothetical protein
MAVKAHARNERRQIKDRQTAFDRSTKADSGHNAFRTSTADLSSRRVKLHERDETSS